MARPLITVTSVLTGILLGTIVNAEEPIPDPVTLRETIRQYELKILELEEKGGAYDEGLGEELIGLGQAYRKSGRHQKAVEAFNKSLHISRVNHGPDNPRQLPVLDLIIETNRESGNWEGLDENYDYYYWVTRRIHGEDNPALLNVISYLNQWHLKAYLSGYDPMPFKHVLYLDKLFHDAINIIEKNYGSDDPRLIEALNGVAVANYYIASHVLNADPDDFEEIRSSSLRMGRPEPVAEEILAKAIYRENTRKKRQDILKRVADIYAMHPDLPVEDHAIALVNLADWYLIYGWRAKALENYNKALRLLMENESAPEIIQKLFGKPVRIPSMTAEFSNDFLDQEYSEEEKFIKLSFDVTREGCARKVRIIENNVPESFMARKYAKKSVRSALFRPQLKDGRTVRAREVEMTLTGISLEERSDPELVNYGVYRDFTRVERCHNRR